MAAWEVAKAAEPRGEVELTPPHGSLSRPYYPWPASPLEEPHNVSCSHCSGSLEAYCARCTQSGIILQRSDKWLLETCTYHKLLLLRSR